MTIKELLINEIDELKETDLEKVVEYVKFLKVKHIFMPLKNYKEKDYAYLYAQFEEEDRELAEIGIAEYSKQLEKED
ncbi:MAG: hypothetical protein H7263_03895 [Candidatus Sericytochromatia bacterium]|nr:hypothetical protein [Candidatus Sericytochromatia bacterium]